MMEFFFKCDVFSQIVMYMHCQRTAEIPVWFKKSHFLGLYLLNKKLLQEIDMVGKKDLLLSYSYN